MRRFLGTEYDHRALDIWLLALRLAVAGFMLTHGWPKFQMLVAQEEVQFADPLGIGQTWSLILAVFAEFFCSVLIALGLYTRLSVIPLIVTMLIASQVVHRDDPFFKQEFALLYALIYMTILIAGPGKYSLDYSMGNRRLRR